jgi:uncharacterized protein YukE
MNQDNHSSKREEDSKTKELEKKVENLQKILDMTRQTIEHDKSMLNNSNKHIFGEMM